MWGYLLILRKDLSLGKIKEKSNMSLIIFVKNLKRPKANITDVIIGLTWPVYPFLSVIY